MWGVLRCQEIKREREADTDLPTFILRLFADYFPLPPLASTEPPTCLPELDVFSPFVLSFAVLVRNSPINMDV